MNELMINEQGTALQVTVARRLEYLEQSIRTLKQTQDEIKAQIQSEMESRNIIKLENEEMTIRMVAGTDAESFDKAKFRKEHPDLYDEYITMKPRAAYITVKFKEAE